MKKIFILFICAVMLFALAACGKTAEAPASAPAEEPAAPAEEAAQPAEEPEAEPAEETSVGMANPMQEYGSLAEINELTGGRLCGPGVMGVTNESYYVIKGTDYDIAHYLFSVNAMEYYFRYAEADEDISGIYTYNSTAYADAAKDETTFFMDDCCKSARWFYGDGQYVLTALDDGAMDEETFRMIVDEFIVKTNPDF